MFSGVGPPHAKTLSTDQQQSQLSAGTNAAIKAGDDILLSGSSVKAGSNVALNAGDDINITAAQEHSASTFGKKSASSISHVGSEISAGGDLSVTAGNGSGDHDLNIVGLLSANDVTNYQEVHEKTFAGVTLSVSSQLGSAAQSIMTGAERLSNPGGVNGLTNSAIAGLSFYEGVKNLKGVYDGLTSTDPNIGTGLAFNIGINAGISHQESTSSSTTSAPIVTGIRAGRSIAMAAQDGSITSDGAQIAAGYDKFGLPTLSDDPLAGDIFLSATNGDINLNAAAGTSDSTTSNNSWSAGVGVNLGCTTKTGCSASVGASGSYGKGGSDTVGTSHTNTHVNGKGDVTILTNDLGLRGATVTGNSVTADVRNLTVESLVDTTKAHADELSLSGQIGFGSTGISGVTQKAKGDVALVSQQSGIHAGTGGLNLTVEKQTMLVGGLITSEAASDRNTIDTGTLTVTDIDTHSSWKAETYGGSIGVGGLSPAPPIKAGERETGKAYSAIGGNIGITITDPTHQTQDIGTIRRDTENTNTSLPGLPDLQNILRDQYKTQADLQQAQKTMAGLVGDIASELYEHATQNRDQAGMDYWKEGGVGRALLHAIGSGILGGVNGWEGALKGAAGAATSSLLAPAIAELVDGMLKGTSVEGTADGEWLAALIGEGLSALVGGAVGGGEGASYGAAQYQYNYLKHEEREEFTRVQASCEDTKNDKDCARADQLRELSYSRDKEIEGCVGSSSEGCITARTDLRIAAAEYLDAALTGDGDDLDGLSLLDRHMVFLDAWKYAVDDDPKNSQALRDVAATLTSDAAKALLTGSRDEIAQIIRDPIIVGAIAFGGAGNARGIIGESAVVGRGSSGAYEIAGIDLPPVKPLVNPATNLASEARSNHILYGNGPGSGGHLWPGQPGKTAFPSSWNANKVMSTISDIATNPTLSWKAQTGSGGLYTKSGKPARFVVTEANGHLPVVDGVPVKVVIEPAGEGIITGYPQY